MNLYDVGVTQLSHRPRFSQELLHLDGRELSMAWNLDRDYPIELAVARLPYRAEAASADFLKQFLDLTPGG